MSTPPQDRRDEVLARIREALGRPTDAHVREATTTSTLGERVTYDPTATHASHRVMSVPTDTPEARVALFAAYCEKLRTRFEPVDDMEQASRRLAAIAAEEGWRKVAAHQGAAVVGPVTHLGLDLLWTDVESGYDPQQLEKCDAGVSGCDFLVAQTGSIVVTPGSAGGRALSVLPPHHVVIAGEHQLIATMGDAMDRLRVRYGRDWPSMISFITGPSRTGDIERILVLGAHGPRKLTVILVREKAAEI